MIKNNPSQDNISDLDLIEHGVKDIIPENEEYYTLDLKRNFDGDEEDELTGFDVSNIDPNNLDELDGPPKSSSIYSDATVVQAATDYQTNSSHHVDRIRKNGSNDHSTSHSDRVGEPGHWGLDEDTE